MRDLQFYSLNDRLQAKEKETNYQPSDFELRTAHYAESLTKLVKKQKATKGTNYSLDFGKLISESDTSRQNLIKTVMNPILTTLKNLNEQAGLTSDISGKALIAETVRMCRKDIDYTRKRLEGQVTLFMNSASGVGPMELKTTQQASLPLQYLETMFCNSRQVMDFENVEARTILKHRVIKSVEIDGEKYDFPDAMKNSALMDKILAVGNAEKTVTLTPADINSTTGKINLFTKFGPDAIPTQDRFNPVVAFEAVTVHEQLYDVDADGVKTPRMAGGNPVLGDVTYIIDSKNPFHMATWASRGQFSISFISPNTGITHNVNGLVDFSAGAANVLFTGTVVALKAKLSLVGGRFRNSFRVSESRTERQIVIDKTIETAYTWNPYDVADKLTLEKIDMLMSATSIIYETVVNVKDHYAFKSLDQEFQDLKAASALPEYAKAIGVLGGNAPNMITEKAVSCTPPITASGMPLYQAESAPDYRMKAIPEEMRKICVSYRQKFNSRVGYETIFYGNPVTTSLVEHLNVIIAAGTEYGGVNLDYSVYAGTVNQQPVKLVATERVADNNVLRVVSKSLSETEEGFKFFQWMTLFDKDGTLRDPANPHLACMVYTDTFKVATMHAMLGELTLENL